MAVNYDLARLAGWGRLSSPIACRPPPGPAVFVYRGRTIIIIAPQSGKRSA